MDTVGQHDSILVEHGPRQDLATMLATWPTVTAILGGLVLARVFQLGQMTGLAAASGTVEIYLVTLGGIGLVYTTRTERVELDDSGIRRYILFQSMGPQRWLRRVIRWEWLDPTPRGAIGLGFVDFRWHMPGGYLEWFRLSVSPQHARAILTHPKCPKGQIDSNAERRLGLVPNRSAAAGTGMPSPH